MSFFDNVKAAFPNRAKEVKELHVHDDLDSGDLAHHHTLGNGPGQAAPGAVMSYSMRVGDIMFSYRTDETDYLKICNGQVLSGDYPELEDLLGSLTLPDLRDQVPGGAGALLGAVGAQTGADTVNLQHNHTLPDHQHSVANHFHTIPNHNHAISNHVMDVLNNTQTTAGGASRLTGSANNTTHNHGGGTAVDGGGGNTSSNGPLVTGMNGAGTNTGNAGSTTQSIRQKTTAGNFFMRVL